MTSGPDRLERITNLVLVLLNTPRPLSLREIGRDVAGYPSQKGAIRQAFERDKRTLRDCGIPVWVERIDGDDQVGYRIRAEDYYLPELDLDDAERAALVLALVAVRMEGAAGNDVARKLGAASREVAPVAVLPALAALAGLQQALRDRAVVEFSFRGRRRFVEAYGLVFRGGRWYLVGRDTQLPEESDMRTFRVDRIEGVPLAGAANSYEIPSDVDLAAETRFSPFPIGEDSDDGAAVVVCELSVDVREAEGVVAFAGEDAVQSRGDDGSVVVRVPVGDESAFVRWVLGLGDAAEVIGPPQLRAVVVERLRSLARLAP